MTMRDSLLLATAGALLLAATAFAQSEEDYEVGDIPDTYARPVYPDGVTQNGACVAFFEVQPDGAVAMGSLSVSCTPELFKASVEDAMRQWRFEPTIVDGQAVAQTGYSARIRFTNGHCVRVSSGNAVDRACALAEE
jgi:hypothetical protein